MGCRISFGVIENYRHENSLEERTWQTPSPWKLGSHHYLDRYVLLHWINPWVMRNPHQQVPHLSPQERKNLHGKNWFWKIQFVHFWIWNAFLSNKFLFLFFSLQCGITTKNVSYLAAAIKDAIESTQAKWEKYLRTLWFLKKKNNKQKEKRICLFLSPQYIYCIWETLITLNNRYAF